MREKTPKTRTMYMHTLDAKPANYDDRGAPYLYFVDGTQRVKLVPSLRQLRREQDNAIMCGPQTLGEVGRYGYVLVEVPDAR